jgi:integrase
MTETIKLTQSRIDALKPPATGEYAVHDTEVPGLTLRVRSTGAMAWLLRYRVGGRGSQERRLTLGDARKVSIKDARDAARAAWGERARGADPLAERKETARRERAHLGACVDAYVRDLERRGATSTGTIASLLRRELIAPLGAATDLATLDRVRIAARITAIAASGRAGAARDFRTRVSVFMNWSVSQGLIPHNPLAGLRLPRATRAEETVVHGRALNETEIRAFWEAAEATGDPVYTRYLRTLLLTGCRRTELSLARWGWVQQHDKATGRSVLVLPREVVKNGRAHVLPLPAPLLAMLSALPRQATSDLIFPAWRGTDTPMSGWSKRWAEVTAKLAELGVAGHVTMHDLRRTARSWWSELGVVEPVAEMMLNHRPRSRLVALYDRSERMDERYEAAERWADFVFDLVEDEGAGCARSAERDRDAMPPLATRGTQDAAAMSYVRGMRARA